MCSQLSAIYNNLLFIYVLSSPFLLQHLQQHENAVEGDACYYHCVLCSYSTKAKLNLIQHVRSMKHQRSESLRKLQRLQKGLPEEEEDLSSIFTIRKCPSSDPGQSLLLYLSAFVGFCLLAKEQKFHHLQCDRVKKHKQHLSTLLKHFYSLNLLKTFYFIWIDMIKML